MKKPEIIDSEIESKLEALSDMYAELNEAWYVHSLNAGNEFILKDKNSVYLYLDELLGIGLSLMEKVFEAKVIVYKFFEKKNHGKKQ